MNSPHFYFDSFIDNEFQISDNVEWIQKAQFERIIAEGNGESYNCW